MTTRCLTGAVTLIVVVCTGTLTLTGTALGAATTRALWHMEDPAVMTDSSGTGNNGTTRAITSVPGTTGNGYHYNGTTSGVDVPHSTSLNPGTAPITITASVRVAVVPGAGGSYDLVRKGFSSTSGGEYKMEILPNASRTAATAFCLFKDGAKVIGKVRSAKNLADGAWHTVSCVRAAGSVTLVVDGVSKTAARTLGSISNTASASVGYKSGGGDVHNGDLDETSVSVG